MYITNDPILSSPAQVFVFFLDNNNRVILDTNREYLTDMFPSLRFVCTKDVLVKNPLYSIIVIKDLEELNTYLNIYHNIAVYVPKELSEIELFKYANIEDLFFHVSDEQYSKLVAFYGVMRSA